MIDVPTTTEPGVLADWAELYVLVSPREPLEARTAASILESEPSFDWSSENQGSSDEKLQWVIDDMLAEIRWRETVAGSGAGLTLSSGLNRTLGVVGEQEALVQTFLCLLASRRRLQLQLDLQEAARLFEQLATHAIGCLAQGPSRRMGWPFDPGDLRFRDRVRLLAQHLGEPLGGFESVRTGVKDLELDVVAWGDFHDQRPGRLTILGQCAIGEDWDLKLLGIGIWTDMIRFALAPISVLAFPWLPPLTPDGNALWRGLSRQGSLLLDRLRLMRLAAKMPLDPALHDRLQRWVDKTQRLVPLA